MSPVFVTNVANQIWVLVAKSFGAGHFDVQVLDTLSLCFTGCVGITEKLAQLRGLRNKYTHDLLWISRHIHKLQNYPDLMAACETECPAAIEIVQHADPLILLAIASEVIQRCKYTMCGKYPWEAMKEACMIELANASSSLESNQLPSIDVLESLFDAFKTWEDDEGCPTRPATRSELVLCINEWMEDRAALDRSRHPQLEHAYRVLQHAIHLLTITEEMGEIRIGQFRKIRLRLTRRRKMAQSKLSRMWRGLRSQNPL